MKKHADYEINFATNTITVTKRFLAAASEMGGDAYETMKKLRDLGMTICVKEIHRGPCKENRYSYKRMERFLENVEDPNYLAEFKVRKETTSYMAVWTWFKKSFPNYQNPEFNDNHKIMVVPADYCEDLDDAA